MKIKRILITLLIGMIMCLSPITGFASDDDPGPLSLTAPIFSIDTSY